MKAIALEDISITVAELAKMAGKHAVILTRGGKPVASVKGLDGLDWESVALANNPRFVALIEESRRSYREEGGTSLAEVRQQLGLKPKPGKTRPKRKPA